MNIEQEDILLSLLDDLERFVTNLSQLENRVERQLAQYHLRQLLCFINKWTEVSEVRPTSSLFRKRYVEIFSKLSSLGAEKVVFDCFERKE